MSDVPTWRLFAYKDNDPDALQDETRVVADWQLEEVIRWCRFRGYDHIYLVRIDSAQFEKTVPIPAVVHRFGTAA